VSDALSRHGPDVAARPVVVPVAVFRVGDPLHRVLRGYKDAPAVSARRHFAGRLRTHLADFVAAHGACMAAAGAGPVDALCVVPSSGRTAVPVAPGRPALLSPGDGVARPLAGVVEAVATLAGVDRVVLRRGPGRTGHLAPHPEAFEVCGDVGGRRVLLLDDTWVTGARMRSAGAALVGGGAAAVTMVVAGRAVDVGAGPAVARWWAWAERRSTDGAGAPPGQPCCLPTCRWRDPSVRVVLPCRPRHEMLGCTKQMPPEMPPWRRPAPRTAHPPTPPPTSSNAR